MNWKFRFRKKQIAAKNEQQIQIKGNQASALLKSEAYQEAMQDLEEKIWQQFMSTEANSPEDREVLYTHLTALKYLDDQLKVMVEKGKTSAKMETMNNAR